MPAWRKCDILKGFKGSLKRIIIQFIIIKNIQSSSSYTDISHYGRYANGMDLILHILTYTWITYASS